MVNTLTEWANRWNIPQGAVNELLSMTGCDCVSGGKVSESAIQQRVRLSASAKGIRLWRNNVGVAENPNGQPIRYGLANESTKINQVIKSSDLIGITPHVVGAGDIGRTFGIFTAIEVKRAGWKFAGSKREMAQLKFILLVLSMGGIGKFTNTGEI
jgi:hypothetical protein